MQQKKRYVICGVSTRAIHFYVQSMLENFKQTTEIVGLLDIDPRRFEVCREVNPSLPADLPCYMPDEFEKMIRETSPDVVLVAGMDCTHVSYIVKALEMGLDVVTEKPMCTNTEDCLRILEAEKRSKGSVICTFNYRYAPIHRAIKEMVMEGKVGRVTHVDLNWYIDIKHGSSYFNRWNRMRKNSGSLCIHKSTHHFDLVNWWLGDIPADVHAFGALNYYGDKGPLNPSKKDGRICSKCDERMKCAYYARWATRNSTVEIVDDHIGGFDNKNGTLFTNYSPEMCIFDSEIDIPDTYVVNVRYKSGALLNYSANFSTPYEGYRLAINGTKGRIEAEDWSKARQCYPFEFEKLTPSMDYYPLFGGRQHIQLPAAVGGHGGGDPLLLEDVFLGPDPLRKYQILADSADARNSILLGDAVWNSIHEEKPIHLDID